MTMLGLELPPKGSKKMVANGRGFATRNWSFSGISGRQYRVWGGFYTKMSENGDFLTFSVKTARFQAQRAKDLAKGSGKVTF